MPNRPPAYASVLVTLLAISCTCASPWLLFRVTLGSFPLYRVPPPGSLNGLTREEVRAKLGPPHEIFPNRHDHPVAVLGASSAGLMGSPLGQGPVLAAFTAVPGRLDAGERWYYYTDLLGGTGYGLRFGLDGCVQFDWI